MSRFEIITPALRRTGDRLAFFCPGYDTPHVLNVYGDRSPRWTYNGKPDSPTFQFSLLNRTGRAVDPAFIPEAGDPPEVCHLFVTEGKIQFLGDCTHALAGQTVSLPAWPEGWA